MKKIRNSRGFTLIELLVVIAIIAVLAVVVILSLNPAELLRQARDSNRLSDFATLKSAVSLFQADVATSSINALGSYGTLYGTSGMGSTAVTTSTFTGPVPPAWGYATTSIQQAFATTTSRAVDGSGWIKINFSVISSGAPLGSLPVDPSNNGTNFYTFTASSTIFKLATKMESTKFSFGGGGDAVSSDGGNSTSTFEQGTGLSL
jgi:prepilin-type N-terminal cleavage/methylation domain-containing protein